MRGIVIFYCVLLSVTGMSEAVVCRSTEDCSDDDTTFCVVNCSDRAIRMFNQPASHGNCRISITSEGEKVQGCYIHECNTSHPGLCVPETALDGDAVSCCCTEDECNSNFSFPPENSTSTDLTPTPPGRDNRTHLYPIYPTHVGPDELVCLYNLCVNDVCETQYEVCSESPLYGNFTRDHHICYAVFIVELDTLNHRLTQHCFADRDSNCTGKCTPKLHTLVSPNNALVDCCCKEEDQCNNVTFDPTVLLQLTTTINSSPTPTMVVGPSDTSTDDGEDDTTNFTIYGVVIGVVLIILLVLITFVILFYCFYLGKTRIKFPPLDRTPTALINSPDSVVSVEGIESVELLERVGRGRFATVWKAAMNNSLVAVKQFPVFSIESWSHEKEIYTTPFFEHDCLLHFIGAEQRTVDYETQYWIVTAYHEYGSLLDFLRVRIVTLENLCVMAESIAIGLAHLHSTFTRDGKYKPAIVHRDFKSKNILVKDDLSCVISDFGLAFKFVSGESPVEAQGQVGTTRYMSPEVLEGAVNFQREAFMRIDMYACGLVLWEIATRCVVDDTNPGDYMQPFEDELKGNPTIEMMKQVVIAGKKRPEFPIAFNVNPQLESFMTTITECWDDDAEARLSAKTVEERIKGLRRDICKPPIIDNEKGVGLMVSLTPSQSMPIFPGKELSSGISCSLPNSYSTLTSPRSIASLTFSPKSTDRNQNNVFAKTSSPTQLTNGYMNIADCCPMQNGHTPHSQLMNSNGSSNKNHKTIAVHNKLAIRVNGRIHSLSETTL